MIDAIEAARAAQGERQMGAAKSRDGNPEAIWALVVAKHSAKSTKIKTLNQRRHLGFTAQKRSDGQSRRRPPSQRRSVAHRHHPRRSARCLLEHGLSQNVRALAACTCPQGAARGWLSG